MSLEGEFAKRREEHEKSGRPKWMWEDEGKVWCLQDYLSSNGEFSEADWDFIRREGLSEEAQFAICDS